MSRLIEFANWLDDHNSLCSVPQEAYDAVVSDNLSKISIGTVRKSLVNHGMEVHFACAPYIWGQLLGNTYTPLDAVQTIAMNSLFAQVNTLYEIHKPADRTKFLYYPYVFNEMCAYLGYTNKYPFDENNVTVKFFNSPLWGVIKANLT